MFKNTTIHRPMALGVLPFLFAFMFLSSTTVFAGEQRIGFIDIQKAISNTREWKKEFSSFKKDYKKQKDVIIAKEARMKKMLEELNKQSFVLDPEKKKKKEEDFRKKKRELERYVQDRNDEFGKKEKEMTDRILKRAVKVIQKVGKEKKYAMILERKSAIYFDPAHDLTDLVIKTYDRTHR